MTVLEAAAWKQENIEYRMTVQEQGSANLAKSVEELKNTVNSLSTDIWVIREIVERPMAAAIGRSRLYSARNF